MNMKEVLALVKFDKAPLCLERALSVGYNSITFEIFVRVAKVELGPSLYCSKVNQCFLRTHKDIQYLLERLRHC